MRERFVFRLFVAGDSPNSSQALQNLRRMCETYLSNAYELDVVDVFLHPECALADGILVTPTLVKLAPQPTRRIVGSLTQLDYLLQALGVDPP